LVDRFNGARVPIHVPSLLCSVVDSQPSKLWHLGTNLDRLDKRHGLLAPDFWASDPTCHGKMFDGDERTLRLMENVALAMMKEQPLPWIERRAVAVGEGNWVADENWEETWEANAQDAMTIAPKTGHWFHNPLHAPTHR